MNTCSEHEGRDIAYEDRGSPSCPACIEVEELKAEIARLEDDNREYEKRIEELLDSLEE